MGGVAKREPQQPIRCEVCQVTLSDAAAHATHLNTRKHKKRSSEPLDVEPAVMNKIVGDLRTCLKFLTPPNWSMSPAEIERMEPTSLSHFPLDQFLVGNNPAYLCLPRPRPPPSRYRHPSLPARRMCLKDISGILRLPALVCILSLWHLAGAMLTCSTCCCRLSLSPKAHYTAQMDEFIASRIAQAAESIATSEEQLAKNKAGTQELRPVEIPLLTLATANLLENTDGVLRPHPWFSWGRQLATFYLC